MLLTTLLVATLSSVPSMPATATSADPSVSLTTAYLEGQQSASKSEAVTSLGTPSKLAIGGGLLTRTLAANFNLGASGPFDGAAMSQETKAIVAMIVGFVVGLGIGHLIAGDKDGFVLFLIIDIVLIALQSVFWAVIPGIWYIGSLASVGLLASHIIQGLDAYGKASGEPLIQHVRDNQIRIASAPGASEAPMTTRTFAVSF